MNRRIVLLAGTASAVGAFGLALALRPAEAGTSVTVHKSPACGCCEAWVKHLRAAGFSVSVQEAEDLAPVKRRLGVPAALESCHTGIVDGYTIEGHVPAREIRRLLAERPAARGLAVPGMPAGSPGMETRGPADRYEVVLFGDNSNQSVYARY